LTDEPSTQTKTDVLDLVISFLMDHEKQMDQMIQRLEKLFEMAAEMGGLLDREPAPRVRRRPQSNAFTITISNPGGFEEMKSLRMEWRTKNDVDPKNAGAGVAIGEMDHPLERG